MVRVVLLVFAIFLFLTVLRGLRIFFSAVFQRPGTRGRSEPHGPLEGEMVRDPICGTWVDRRLALTARRGSEFVPVCSEKCLKLVEAR